MKRAAEVDELNVKHAALEKSLAILKKTSQKDQQLLLSLQNDKKAKSVKVDLSNEIDYDESINYRTATKNSFDMFARRAELRAAEMEEIIAIAKLESDLKIRKEKVKSEAELQLYEVEVRIETEKAKVASAAKILEGRLQLRAEKRIADQAYYIEKRAAKHRAEQMRVELQQDQQMFRRKLDSEDLDILQRELEIRHKLNMREDQLKFDREEARRSNISSLKLHEKEVDNSLTLAMQSNQINFSNRTLFSKKLKSNYY